MLPNENNWEDFRFLEKKNGKATNLASANQIIRLHVTMVPVVILGCQFQTCSYKLRLINKQTNNQVARVPAVILGCRT